MKKILSVVAALFFCTGVFAQDAAEMITKANDALKAGNYAEAFDLYDKAMSNLGDVQVPPSINYNIAFAAMQADKNEAALKYFDKAIEVGTADQASGINVAKCHENKGSVYNKMKDLNNALASYEKALELYTEKPGTLIMNAAVTAYKLENFEKAISYFDKAFEAGFKPEDALLNKAQAYRKLNNNDAFKQTLITGNEKFPENKKFSAALAGIYVGEGNEFYKAGVTILNAANKKVTDGKLKTEDAAYKSEVDKVKAEFAKAIDILEKAVALDPANANAQKLIDACKQVK